VAWLSTSRVLAEVPRPSRLQSQALKALVGGLVPEARPLVLDLGAPVAANVEFLSSLSCRVRVGDLHRSFPVETAESREPEAIGRLLEQLLPLAPGERFDAVLVWDLFDYMRPHEVSALAERLAPAVRPEAPVLVLTSTRRDVPVTPRRYRILDEETLDCDGPHEPARACPRHTQHDLARMMAGFAVRRSVLLRSGIQEHLFVRVPGAAREETATPRGEHPAGEASALRPWFRRVPV
jgi:hypothetical protein